VTQLQALGGLSLEPLGVRNTAFTRPKPLLLLAYLALEGTQQRNHLAELFWQEGNRMKSLSMALTLLRQGAGDVIDVDAKQVKSSVASDVRELLGALDKSDWEGAANLYAGAFLEGVVLEDWSSELEEWVYQTREYLAERVQYALLQLAEDAAKRQDFQTASHFAERAYKLPGLAGTEVVNLKRLYTLLCAGNSLLAPEVRKEAESYDLALQLTSEEARAFFKPETKPATTLPMRGTSFIGRDVELTELATLLNKPNVSLLTLLGTAGVGKTRLALQLALEQQKLAAFKDGVYFVPLESLEDSSLIAATLLGHLSLTQQGKTEPIEQLVNFFADKSVLLVLDNFEHLTAGAMVLSLLLSNCQNLKLLITSRETLRLEEEHVFALEGLSFPKTSSNEALLSDAVQLFKERAQQVKPQFELDEQLADVIRICQLVEGLPLGIELAASWVKFLSGVEIAREIQGNLEILTSQTTNIPERHRSLKAAFDYSWKRLTQKEQRVLQKLSTFRGGFRREAASEVTGATIPTLASLVDKSLVRALPTGRYDFHPLVQHFVYEKFVESDDKLEAQKNHARYFSQLLQSKKNVIPRARQNEVTDSLAEELSNLEVMWHYLCNHQLVDELANLATAMFLLHYNMGRLAEGAKLSAKARAALDKTNPEHAFALGSLCVREAGYLKYLALFRESVRIAEEGLTYLQYSNHSDTWVKMITGFNEAGVSSYHLGQFQQAMRYYQQAIELARTHHDLRSVSVFENNLANLLWHLGENEKARDILTNLIQHYNKLGDWERVISASISLASIEGSLGKYETARTLLEKAQRIYEAQHLRSVPILCELVSGLGVVDGCLGNMEKAVHYHERALILAKETGSPLYESSALLDVAHTFIELKEFAKAKEHLKRSIAILWVGSDRGRLLFALIGWAKNELVKGYPENAVTLLALVLSQVELAPKDQKTAREVLEMAQTKIAKKEINRLQIQGKTSNLEHVVHRILHDTAKETSELITA
jgi:predicted ATPase